MKPTITSVLLLLLGCFQNAQACDCFPISTFCETITYQNNGQIWNFLSIYRVKVESSLPNGIKVSIFQTYAGEDKAGQQLYVKNGNGGDCVLFASTFLDQNQDYIIAAQLLNDTLSISECGISYLKIENGMVQGAIAPGITEVALADFPNTTQCGDLTPVAVFVPDQKDRLIVVPTLATARVIVKANQTFWGQPTGLKLVVYDAAGRLVFTQNYPDFDYYTPALVDTKGWNSGVYMLRLSAGKVNVVVRLMKVG